VTASNPNLCELDLDFGDVPLGVLERAVIQVKNNGTSPLDLSPVNGVLDPEFSVVDPSGEAVTPGGVGAITVDFRPDTARTVTSSFTFPTSGTNRSCPVSAGPTGSILTVEVTGNGIGNGIDSCFVAQPDTLDFGNTLLNTTATESLALINNCTAAVTAIVTIVGGGDQNLFTVTGAPATLNPGISATVNVFYRPLALELRSLARVTFVGSKGENAVVHLLGEPIGMALTVVPNPVDFGVVPLRTTAEVCTTVSNQANLSVDITGVSAFASENHAFAIASADDPNNFPQTPITLAGGASAQVCFSFTPPIAQQYSGQVTLVTTDPSGTNPTVELTGHGVGPQITCKPTSLDFGPIAEGMSSILAVFCTNTGTAVPGLNLRIDPPDVSSDVFSAQFDTSTNPYPDGGLDPGQEAQIDVTYAPILPSNDVATLFIYSNDAENDGLAISLTGQGTN
jgi:hypothetical protein